MRTSSDVANQGDYSTAEFHELVDEAAERLKAGEPVDLDSYIRLHPHFADRFRQIWPSLRILATLGSSHDATASIAPINSDLSYTGTAGSSDHMLGDFRIVREIGRGGMGVVYEAQQLSLDRRVALKVLPYASMLDERQLQRFKNESRAAAGLHHANIVPIHSVGCERGVQFYAMQYIEGQTLAEVIRALRIEAGTDDAGRASSSERKPGSVHSAATLQESKITLERLLQIDSLAHGQPNVDADQHDIKSERQPIAACSTERWPRDHTWFKTVAQIGVQVAEALEYAHSMGVVHRDIKPANLIVDYHRRVWIADFGLAQIECDAALTMTGDILGTLRYMSPEQARGDVRNIDHRADIYSLGATLYELLTLQPLFDGQLRETVLRQIESEDPQSLRSANLRTPADLETIILKSLAKEPKERYVSAGALASDLKQFYDDEPIKARRASILRRGARWSHRNRVLVRVLSAGSILVALVAVLAAWRIDQEQRARRFYERLAEVALQDSSEHRYVTSINIADHSYERSDFAGLEAVLQEWIPQFGERDLRGFEWSYLSDLSHNLAQPFARHEGAAYGARFSPDGRSLATCGADGVRLWAWPSREPLQQLQDSAADVNGVAWSPDGKLLVAFSDDQQMRIYSAQDWTLQMSLELGGALVAGDFTPDGQLLVVGERSFQAPERAPIGENCLLVIDAKNWQTRTKLYGPKGLIQGVAVSHDGRFAAAASSDGAAYVFDLQTHEQRLRLSVDEPVENRAIAFAHHRPLLAVVSRFVRLYDAESGLLVAELAGTVDGVEGIAFGPNDKTLCIASRNQRATLWVESLTGKWEPAHIYRHTEPLWSIAVHADGGFVTTGNYGGLWAHNRFVAEDRRRLSCAAADVDAWLNRDRRAAGCESSYELAAARAAENRESPLPDEYMASAWTNDNRLLVAQNLHRLTLWNSDVTSPLANFRSKISPRAGQVVAMCNDQQHVVTAGAFRTIVLFQREPWSQLSAAQVPYDVREMTISADGKTLFIATKVWATPESLSYRAGGAHTIVRALDIPTLRDASDRVPTLWRSVGHLLPVKSDDLKFLMDRLDSSEMRDLAEALRATSHRVTTTRDCNVVAAYRIQDDTFHVWAAPDWNIRTRFAGLGMELNDFCLSPDGRTLAAIVASRRVQLWNTLTSRPLLSLEPHMLNCQKITFSPDGRRLVVLGQGLAGPAEIVVWGEADL